MAVHLTTGWPLLAAAAALAVVVALVVLILIAVRRARRRAEAAASPDPATPAGAPAGADQLGGSADTRSPGTAPRGQSPVGAPRGQSLGREVPTRTPGAGAQPAPRTAPDPPAIGPADRLAIGDAAPAADEPVPVTERRWSEIDMRELAAASRQLARPVLRGVVTGGSGEPLADAVLTVINVAGGQAGNARTGADGGYQLTMPAEGGYVVIARGLNHEPHAATVEVHGVLTTCDIRLASSAGLTGTVADPDGSPVAGATVILTNTSGAVVSALRSNAHGGYGVTDLTPGLYTVTATAPEREPMALLVDVPPTGIARQDVTFAPRTLTLAGTTRHSDGRPLADIRVSVVDSSGTEVATTYSDAAGRYEFAGLRPGHYTVAASGYPLVSTPLDAIGRVEDHDIRLGYAGSPATTATVDEEYAQ
ncbi:MSCRAMM family protein [Actinocatenispora sera]|nr:carboxypeptidase-like regulatory domain-containing protein [Actinocatenispora sera]